MAGVVCVANDTGRAFLQSVTAALPGSPTKGNAASAAVLRAATLTELYVRTWSSFQLAIRLSVARKFTSNLPVLVVYRIYFEGRCL